MDDLMALSGWGGLTAGSDRRTVVLPRVYQMRRNKTQSNEMRAGSLTEGLSTAREVSAVIGDEVEWRWRSELDRISATATKE